MECVSVTLLTICLELLIFFFLAQISTLSAPLALYQVFFSSFKLSLSRPSLTQDLSAHLGGAAGIGGGGEVLCNHKQIL